MLPETLVTLIWTLDQSGVFSWPTTRPQKRAAASRANTGKLPILWAMNFSEQYSGFYHSIPRMVPHSKHPRPPRHGASAGWPLQPFGAQSESVYRLFFPVLKDRSVVEVVFGRAF